MKLDKSYASITLAAMAMYRGFDEPCSVFTSLNNSYHSIARKAIVEDENATEEQLLPIPTLEQLQRWLREKHKIIVYCFWHLVDNPLKGVWVPFKDCTAMVCGSRIESIRYPQEFIEYYDALAYAVLRGLEELQETPFSR